MTPELFTTSRGSLETRLYTPSKGTKDGSATNLAVFIHPWSPLGGNMFDPVLRSLKPVFISHEFHVLLYNSCPSFTGIPEGQDLRELVAGTIAKLGGHINHLVIMGYSHGSLIASLHPLLAEPVRTSHVFLCYPLSVRGLLTFFRSGVYESALRNLFEDPRSHILVIYGDRDQFTSAEKYARWVEQLDKDHKGHLNTVQIHGADHFWTGTAGDQMCTTVGQWLYEL